MAPFSLQRLNKKLMVGDTDEAKAVYYKNYSQMQMKGSAVVISKIDCSPSFLSILL